MGIKLQKGASSFFHARSTSGQSTRDSIQSSPETSPAVEKAGFQFAPDSQPEYKRPLSANPASRPTSRLRNENPHSSSTSDRTPSSSTASTLAPSATERDEKRTRRKSWFNRTKSSERVGYGPEAWVIGHNSRPPYDLTALDGSRRVPELWDETDSGDCLVYLFPRTSGKGPSFRINSSLLASSRLLSKMILPLETASMSLGDPHTPPLTPKDGSLRYKLFMPIALKSDSALSLLGSPQGLSDDMKTLIATRNLLAFLAGQSLIASQDCSTTFSVFMTLSKTLRQYEFSNSDGSSFGEVATSSFDNYVDELGLADVRTCLEKTIEGVVLGEHMKNIKLYNEAFTHAAGKHDELIKLKSPKYGLISPISTNRLYRAAMDLEKRQSGIRRTLKDFEFPSIFSGTLNSKTTIEHKQVDLDVLRDSFFATRKFVTAFYKDRYGSWPPKVSNRNELETSGLNRIVYQDLYHDLCGMYDLLADRSSLTNRTADGVLMENRYADAPHIRALRAVLSEYDRSTPPCKPPVPFDCFIVPTLRQSRSQGGWGDAKKEAKAMAKKLKDDDIAEIMTASHNTDVPPSAFLNSFREFERREARSCTIKELMEVRMGQWLFMYAALQVLPMVAIDGPQLQHTAGVEYFLCEPPSSGVPWAREDGSRNVSLSGVSRAGDIAQLPADLLGHGIEGIYFQSHCWQVAKKWSAGNPILTSALRLQHQSNVLTAKPASIVGAQAQSSRSGNPAISIQNRKAIGLGLGVPSGLPTSSEGTQSRRPVSVYNPNLTFDVILGADEKKRR